MYFGRCAVGGVRALHASCGVQKNGVCVGECSAGWVRSVYASRGVPKRGTCVGGGQMSGVRAIHTKCGVPQNGILTNILLTYILTHSLHGADSLGS